MSHPQKNLEGGRGTKESFRLLFKCQTASDKYDVTHLNIHELQKIHFS